MAQKKRSTAQHKKVSRADALKTFNKAFDQPHHGHAREKTPKPDKLGKKIDALFDAREARLEVKRQHDALKKREELAEQEVIALLNAENLKGARGTRASVSIHPKVVPKPDPEKWVAIFSWIAANGAWDLIRKQINSEPFRDRIEQGVKIPNVAAETVLDLSVRAIG